MDVVSDLKEIWFIVAGLVALVAWSVRLESLVKTIATKQSSIKDYSADIDVLNQRTKILSGIMNPEKLETNHKQIATIESNIKYLRRDVDDLRKAGL